ncbi:MAG: dihydrolipoyl dehydrogenase, partial [Aestuariivirga sp.]
IIAVLVENVAELVDNLPSPKTSKKPVLAAPKPTDPATDIPPPLRVGGQGEGGNEPGEAEAKKPPSAPISASSDADKPSSVAISPPSSPIQEASEADVLVLGAGPGGYSAAFRAADLGLKVVLVERYPSLGGVCLNVGCIPSKALLHTAHTMEHVADLAAHGIEFGRPKVELAKLRAFKTSVVNKLTSGLVGLAKRRKVTVVHGLGMFTGANAIEVTTDEGARTLTFKHCIIAAGSQSVKLPNLPQDRRIWDSTRALEIPEIPDRMLVIGGGIIGLEIANVFSALGSGVDIVEMTSGLLPGTDADLIRPLAKRMKSRCPNIWLGTKVAGVEAKKDSLYVKLEGSRVPQNERYDVVLVAVGRKPNGKAIGADAAGVTVDERGFIPVDHQMRTNVPHIFAIGDIAGPPMLAHKAVHEGKVAAEVIAGHKASFDVRCIPSVVYTEPEVAWTGLTEAEAKQKNIEVKVGRFPWAANGRSLGMGYSDGTTKILFDKESGRALGAGAVGPNAGELMAELSLAIEMGADAHDIGLTIHAHPTLSETTAMAAEQIAGTLTDL